jgi:hypothetical protein
MVAKIYTSDFECPPIPDSSVFTHLFSSTNPQNVGGYPSSLPAFIDAATGTTITRGQLKHLALSLAYGLRNHPTTSASAKRGATFLVYSQNSLTWPVVLFGAGRF